MAEQHPTITIMNGPRASESVAIGDSLTIGRTSENMLSLPHDLVSRYHARIERRPDGLWLTDLSSSNGTLLNNQPVNQPVKLSDGDRIRIADTQLLLVLPAAETLPKTARMEAAPRLTGLSGPLQGQTIPLTSYPLRIGRIDGNDVVLDDPRVSRHHAQVELRGSTFWISDLDSGNGIYVNQRRITAAYRLLNGDVIQIGDSTFRATVPAVRRDSATIIDTQVPLVAPEAAASSGRSLPMRTALVIVIVITLTALIGIVLMNRMSSHNLSSDQVQGVARSIVQIYAVQEITNPLRPQWVGSGTIISPSGQILTNCHVACDSPFLVVLVTVDVESPPVPKYLAIIQDVSEETDLAVLQIIADLHGDPVVPDSLNLPFLAADDSDKLTIGQPLYIFGYPTAGGLTITVTRGSVSGFESESMSGREQRTIIKTDARVSSGNSGGAAVNTDGRLIGVPTTVSVDERTNDGVPLIRPINLLQTLIAP